MLTGYWLLATVGLVETWERWQEWGASFPEGLDGGSVYVWVTYVVLVLMQVRLWMVDFPVDLFQIWGMQQDWGWRYLGGRFLLWLCYFVLLTYPAPWPTAVVVACC